jgi:hypothetical protein
VELARLTLPQVLALFGAAGAAVIALYFLRLRRRGVAVPGIFLWEKLLNERRATRFLSRLKSFLSLLVALTLVGVLVLSLGDPQPARVVDARNTVVLIDAGVTMQAIDVFPSRLAEARRRASLLVEDLAAADRMLIAQMDAVVTPLCPMSSDRRLLREALDSLEPTDLSTRLAPALRFARGVLRGRPNPEIIIISDGIFGHQAPPPTTPGEGSVVIRHVPVGKGDRNVAVTGFSVRRYPLDRNRSELFLQLHNASCATETVDLHLLGDGRPIEVETLKLESGARVRRVYDDITGVEQTLQARIESADGNPDQLPADDTGYAVLPERARPRVLCVSNGNRYLEAALLLDEYLEAFLVSPRDYPTDESHDLYVFDRFLPPEMPSAPVFLILADGAPGNAGLFEIAGTIERPFFDVLSQRHPLLRWTALRDVNIASAVKVRPRKEDVVVGASERGPLILTGHRGGFPFVALTFDIRRSDLPLRTAWPLLLLNSVDWFFGSPNEFRSSFTVGESNFIDLKGPTKSAVLVAPDRSEKTVPVVGGRVSFAGTRSGFHVLKGRGLSRVVALNRAPGAGADIAPRRGLAVDGRPVSESPVASTRSRYRPWVYLLLFALVILGAEWFTYHRRWTV